MCGLTSVGLVYDLIGVTVLGYAFFATPVSAFFLNSQTFWGGNAGVLEAGIETRTDGATGTGLLIVGFILQWLGASRYGSEDVGAALLGLLVLFVFGYFLLLRRKLIQLQLQRAKEFEEHWKKK